MTVRAAQLWFVTIALAVLTSLWSYIFADPNFLLVAHPWYVRFQETMHAWQGNPWSGAPIFLLLVLSWFSVYRSWMMKIGEFSPFARWIAWGSVLGILVLGHNALSHDIFNYLFNAKMVLEYGSNPHVQTALDFAQDPWTRFMHNTHTPAPYGWGWTLLSLVPYSLGLGKFALAYLVMKLWMVLGLIATVLSLAWLEKKVWGTTNRFWLFAWNPLVLLEVALNGHNDVWMMWPALVALALLLPIITVRWSSILSLFVAGGLLGASIYQKFVTVVLLPLVPLFLPLNVIWQRWPFLDNLVAFGRRYWPDLAALALLAPLLTARSQQFHPWYLVWALCFLPLVRSSLVRAILLGLSVSSLLRYLPWLDARLEYSPEILALQKAITATGAVAGVITWWKNRSRV